MRGDGEEKSKRESGQFECCGGWKEKGEYSPCVDSAISRPSRRYETIFFTQRAAMSGRQTEFDCVCVCVWRKSGWMERKKDGWSGREQGWNETINSGYPSSSEESGEEGKGQRTKAHRTDSFATIGHTGTEQYFIAL